MTQKYLGTTAMICFIAFMNMFIPLSTDLYLPAMPEMGNYFHEGSMLVGMTLTVFFLMFAVSIVFFGPVSDKYGRRNILIGSTILYIIASVICAAAGNIYVLILGRVLQAVGAGAIITVATALIKECFDGKVMARILAVTQALGVIAPMVAPLIGGFLLTFTSWRGSFVLLAILGTVNLVLAFLLTETLPPEERYKGSILQSFSLLANLLKYKRFIRLLLMFSLLAAPYMAYLAMSSFVYVNYFGLTAQEYSYFFAANSAAAILGPVMYLWLKRHFANRQLIIITFIVSGMSSVLLLTLGSTAAFAFLLSFLPFTVIESIARPLSMEILLGEVEKNVGTASAMINFFHTFLGSIGMALGTLPWPDFINGLGIIMLAAVILGVIVWLFVPAAAGKQSRRMKYTINKNIDKVAK